MTASKLGNLPIERLAECPKTMTNGPCGGVGVDGTCEVDRSKLCVWHEALRDSPTPETRKLAPAPDWTQDFTTAFQTLPTTEVIDIAALPHKNDRPLHSGSRFEQLLRAGHFVITAELNPPDSADLSLTLDYANTIHQHVDACHISDNALAQPHMNGIATAALVQQAGIEPILHMACRDRNRLALQADMLGAHALGVRNILCLTGDHPSQGDHPQGKPVFDVDASPRCKWRVGCAMKAASGMGNGS
jgi:methylenetetrahydrofolate reductase (NADPH)